MPPSDLPDICEHDDCRRLKGHSGVHNPHPSEVWSFFKEKDSKKLSKAGFATPRGGRKGAYQNHVTRSNRVIIPFEFMSRVDLKNYQDDYVVRLFPHQYFESKRTPKAEFLTPSAPVRVGVNAFVLYRTHDSFEKLPPLKGWKVRSLMLDGEAVTKRSAGVVDIGEYVLRLPTLGQKAKREEGPAQGLFATEYADDETNYLCKCVLVWLTIQTVDSPYTAVQALHLRAVLRKEGLDDAGRFERAGVLRSALTQCPLCLRHIHYRELHGTVAFDEESGLENAGDQVEGSTRSTVVNLFHLRPLFYRSLVHIPQNVAWGHAVCNTRLGQRPCHSLDEIIEMGRKIGFIREEGVETFGWMSDDDVMIRSHEGAVWIQIASEGTEGPPKSTEVVIDEAELVAEAEIGS